MSAIALQALADETGGQLVGESVALQNLAIDSREVKAGDLFAALSGQRVDGHDFAPQALAAGASALAARSAGTQMLVKGPPPARRARFAASHRLHTHRRHLRPAGER